MITLPSLLLRIALVAALPPVSIANTLANSNTALIAAHDAYKKNDVRTLSRLADSMPLGPLQWYPAYWLTQKALERQDDTQIKHFLTVVNEGVMADTVRLEWLKQLGKRGDWELFTQEWQKLPAASRDEESQCYNALLVFQQQEQIVGKLDNFLESRPLAEGCNRLIKQLADSGLINDDWLWKRIRLLLAANYLTAAKQLAKATGLGPIAVNNPERATSATQGGQEIMVYALLTKAKNNINGAAYQLEKIGSQLSKAQLGFAWGQLAWYAARRLNTQQALEWFERSDRKQLTNQQWEWWARSALRQKQWGTVNRVIREMPSDVAHRPAWLYWQARALKMLNRLPEAHSLLIAASSNGHHYYALLALEELGNSLSEPPDTRRPNKDEVSKMRQDAAIQRALALFTLSQNYKQLDFRKAAQSEWRWGMRSRTDMELLAAAEIARKLGFYDMAIYSAERTKKEHDFALRYLTPYREITQVYAQKLDIDNAWVYGLIRQESRFITAARSGAGASGLMQLMPATARWAAGKIGLGDKIAINDIKTNIQLGTWYLRYVLDSLSGSPVMATAAYNAGPSRARAWQGATELEGTVYVETIPFNETRDYVQKVMANAAWYASNMGHNRISLKERLGIIPSR